MQYSGPNIAALLTALEEATRAVPEGGPNVFVRPGGGELEKLKARFHHIVFGRRGSGKTSLMRHLESENRAQSKAAIWIDEELFSSMSYPNVLVSSVLEVMRGLRDLKVRQIDESKARRPWWRLWDGSSRNSGDKALLERIERIIANLEELRQFPDNREIEWTRMTSGSNTVEAIGSIKAGPIRSEIGGQSSAACELTSRETLISSKQDFLERTLDQNRAIIMEVVDREAGGFVFLDEFSSVDRNDQPRVLGYMHRLLKDTGLWLKVASVRYRTKSYSRGERPQGMQLTHDANEISLDQGLRLFDSTRVFLESILSGICEEQSVDFDSLFTDGAKVRLVVAAGGVPRDYLRLARESIRHAQNRGPSQKQGSDKVIAEDVNSAAGETMRTKMSDLREDAPNEAAELDRLLSELGNFCRDNEAAYFLVDNSDPELTAQVDQLQDLRLVHLVSENETVPSHSSARYRLLLLDVAYLSHKRARRVDFEGWIHDRTKRRRGALVYSRPQKDSTPVP